MSLTHLVPAFPRLATRKVHPSLQPSFQRSTGEMSDGGLPSEAVCPCRQAEAALQAEAAAAAAAAAAKIETVEIKVCFHMERGGGNAEGSPIGAESGKKVSLHAAKTILLPRGFRCRKGEWL